MSENPPLQTDLNERTYQQLRDIARYHLAGESSHTLQPTELVHEAYERMSKLDMPFKDKQHFINLTSTMMRRILVDYARQKNSQKRGAGQRNLTLLTQHHNHTADSFEVFKLDTLLTELESLNPRKARIAELHYFCGLTQQEVANQLDISTATVSRELMFIRAWLHSQFEDID